MCIGMILNYRRLIQLLSWGKIWWLVYWCCVIQNSDFFLPCRWCKTHQMGIRKSMQHMMSFLFNTV